MILLDTHVLLWLAADQKQLSEKAKEVIASNADNLYVSSISAFEISLKHKKGHLQLPQPPGTWFKKALKLHGIEEVYINSDILVKACMLPSIHNDPADRIIIATAQIHNAKILSKDKLISQYPDAITLWN